MGRDKAAMLSGQTTVAVRIATELSAVCDRVTVLGQESIAGFEFLPDLERYAGPLAALAQFAPSRATVFVASCDMPLFSREVVRELAGKIGDSDAAIPSLSGRLQPLCGLYAAPAWEIARELVANGEKRIMAWVERLRVTVVALDDCPLSFSIRSANTPEEWDRLTESQNQP